MTSSSWQMMPYNVVVADAAVAADAAVENEAFVVNIPRQVAPFVAASKTAPYGIETVTPVNDPLPLFEGNPAILASFHGHWYMHFKNPDALTQYKITFLADAHKGQQIEFSETKHGPK